MIHLDYRDTRPLYEQVTEKFETLILRGVLQPDEKLPSVRSMAVELSVNPNTIQRAYSELERRGLIYTVQGRGNFVGASTELRRHEKEQALEAVRTAVQRALELGVTEQELENILSDAAGNGQRERGNGND